MTFKFSREINNRIEDKKDLRTIILYIRVSSDDQVKFGYSIDEQIGRLHSYLDYRVGVDLDNRTVIIDEGKSANKGKRKGYNEILRLITQKKVKAVVIADIDRFTRNVRDSQDIIDIVEKYEVQLVSPKYDIDTSTAQGRANFNDKVNRAEYESNAASERTKEKMLEGTRQGFYVFGGLAPTGYEKLPAPTAPWRKIIVPTESGREIIPYMFQSFIEDSVSVRELAKRFSLEKLFGTSWSTARLNELLKNHVYYGTIKIGGEKFSDHTEAIITKELFDLSARRMKFYSKKIKHQYIFGNRLKCSKCDNFLYKISGTSVTGKSHLYYKCRDCKLSLPLKKFEEYNEDKIIDFLSKQKNTGLIASYARKIDDLKRDLSDFQDLYLQSRKGDPLSILNKCDQITAEIELLNSQVEQIKKTRVKWKRLTRDEKNKLVRKYVFSITVDIKQAKILKIIPLK